MAHQHPLFPRSWVESDGGVKLSLGDSCLHRDGEALDHLGSIGSNHVATENLIGLFADHQLHENLILTSCKCVFHRPEDGLVDVNIPIQLLTGLWCVNE